MDPTIGGAQRIAHGFSLKPQWRGQPSRPINTSIDAGLREVMMVPSPVGSQIHSAHEPPAHTSLATMVLAAPTTEWMSHLPPPPLPPWERPPKRMRAEEPPLSPDVPSKREAETWWEEEQEPTHRPPPEHIPQAYKEDEKVQWRKEQEEEWQEEEEDEWREETVEERQEEEEEEWQEKEEEEEWPEGKEEPQEEDENRRTLEDIRRMEYLQYAGFCLAKASETLNYLLDMMDHARATNTSQSSDTIDWQSSPTTLIAGCPSESSEPAVGDPDDACNA